jgi:hypothetical protein
MLFHMVAFNLSALYVIKSFMFMGESFAHYFGCTTRQHCVSTLGWPIRIVSLNSS